MKKALLTALFVPMFFASSLFAQGGAGGDGDPWYDFFIPPIIDVLIEEMDDDEYTVREDAEDIMSGLLWLVPSARPDVEDAGDNSNSPEVKMRVRRIFIDMDSNWGNDDPQDDPPQDPDHPSTHRGTLENRFDLPDDLDDF